MKLQQVQKSKFERVYSRTKINDDQKTYTEVYVWGSDACGQLGLEL